jgi:hypothetical protein
VALEALRRAAFHAPRSALGQFALACAYLGVGDLPRAQATLLYTQELLGSLDGDALVPGSDAMPVETLRQTVQTHLKALEARPH